MGMVFPGIPEEITLKLAKLASAISFIETGTYRGNTTRWAAKHFKNVFTIENSEFHFKEAKLLAEIPGIKPLFGDSRVVLPSVVAELGQSPSVFFLDGHWSGGETAGERDECPLLDELKSLQGRAGDIILIDDARLFHSPPPHPHNPAYWPTIGEIVCALCNCQDNPYIAIVDDVIFCLPNTELLTDCFIEYSRDRSQKFWKTFKSGSSIKNHLIGNLSSAKKSLWVN